MINFPSQKSIEVLGRQKMLDGSKKNYKYIKDQESWKFSQEISLEKLRSLKALVKDKAQVKLHLEEDS